MTWTIALGSTGGAGGDAAGRAIGAVAEPGDTIVSVLGDANVVEASELSSPYTYLWSLPSRTLDPTMVDLRRTLDGPEAPAWFVVRGPGTGTLLRVRGVGDVVQERYRRVTTLCGHPVYLRRDLTRDTPTSGGVCTRPLVSWHDDVPTDLGASR